MRHFLCFFVAITIAAGMMAQSRHLISPQANSLLYPAELPDQASIITSSTPPGNDLPIGTITTDAVTAIKVGETSDYFSFLLEENTQLSAISASDGDAIAFIYRQEYQSCGTSVSDIGQYRYSISTNGGMTWDVGPAGTASPGNSPIGCYGIGPVTTNAEQIPSFPNFLLSFPGTGNSLSDMIGVYTGPVQSPAQMLDWNGIVAGVVTDPSGTPGFTQEEYFFQAKPQYQSYQLTERVPGEYWYVAWDYEKNLVGATIGEVLKINKGLYNSATQEVEWESAHSVPMQFVKFVPNGGIDSVSSGNTPLIAFSPDGMTGYVSVTGDIGDRDSVLQPVFIATEDGGMSWGKPYEVDLKQFSELRDSLQSYWSIVDTTSGDTIPAGNGIPSTAFSHDLVVDQNGHPHFVCIVTNSGFNKADGSVSLPNYAIHSGLRMFVCDITLDAYGDPNVLIISPQATFRGYTDPSGTGSGPQLTIDPWIQASRNPDGSKVFFSWTESDTTGMFGNSENNFPNFLTRGIDVNLLQATAVINHTFDDATWSGKAFMPKMAPVILDDGAGNYSLPAVITELFSGTLTGGPASFWYFSDVAYADSNFTENLSFFYSCKDNPIVLSSSLTTPACGSANGSISVTATGGIGGYSYQWDSAALAAITPIVTGLSAGIYQVEVLDSLGCSESLTVALNDSSAGPLVLDSVANISCYGANNGYASIMPSGIQVSSYLWSNGETTATAAMLPPGVQTLLVTDTAGCQSWVSVEIHEPDSLSFTLLIDDVSCFGEADGCAYAYVCGGTGTLSYAWGNGGNTPGISGLSAGIYPLTVTDENGCSNVVDVAVTGPDELLLSITGTSTTACFPPFNGFATANFTGGTSPVIFSWVGENGFQGSSNMIFGLEGGNYVVTAVDANGCTVKDSIQLNYCYIGSEEDEFSAGIQTMSVMPNPNHGIFTLNMELDSRQDVAIEVLNLQGKVVQVFEEHQIQNLRKEFTLSDQVAGIYFLQIITENGSASRKVVVR